MSVHCEERKAKHHFGVSIYSANLVYDNKGSGVLCGINY